MIYVDFHAMPLGTFYVVNTKICLQVLQRKQLMPQVFNIPKVEHDQPCSTLVVLFFKISLFIYVILGNGPISTKNNVNKQTNLEKQNNQS